MEQVAAAGGYGDSLPPPEPEDQVGFHNHSEGSFLDGFSKVGQIARRARELRQSAVALTDHGEVNQHLAFQKACRAEGVRPIFGMEGYWCGNIAKAREAKDPTGNTSHLCLIAKNQEGLRNLWALSSTAYDATHFYNKPLADPELLTQHAAGLYASDGCMLTGLNRAVVAGDEDLARQYMGALHKIFRENFYVELHTWQYMELPEIPPEVEVPPVVLDADGNPWLPGDTEEMVAAAQRRRDIIEQHRLNAEMTQLNQAKVRLATELSIPMVVVNDSHYAYREHWRYKELVWGFKADSNPDQAEISGQKADWLMSESELHFWMRRHGISREIVSEAIKYSAHMAENCDVEIKPMLGMPLFTKSEADDWATFLDLVEKGFRDRVERGGLDRDLYWRRMESELQVICDKRFAGYFLIVTDYVRAARDGSWAQYVLGTPPQPMMIGPGRGSVGGSLVAWLLGITSIDPIKYGLLFERFLIPERTGFPDIDIDFPRSKRAGMKEYVKHRWGHDHVCSICTMSRNQARGTVKDIGRMLGIDYKELEDIGKLVERITAAEIEEEESAEEDVRTWAEVIEDHKKVIGPYVEKHPKLFEDLDKMFGVIRQTGVHAAAVLISDQSLAGGTLPTRVKNGTLTTQFDMYGVEELGGLKGDFLALRHLDALQIAADLAKERHGADIDYESFDERHYEDPAIWTQIDEGQTVGIFQLGTPGGTESAIEFRPRSMVEVADLISINRPGVRDAGLYHAYLRRRAAVEAVTYQHPMMEPITQSTFGILVYQEQLMQASRELAGFTQSESSDLQKAVGKKIMAKVLAMKEKFVTGCMNNDQFAEICWDGNRFYPTRGQQAAEEIWRSIEASGRYCFNKSHALGYAMIAAWEIWMKHYYSAEMLVGFMRVDEAKRNFFVRDARRKGLTILPPDINESRVTFRIEGQTIRYGLDAIHGVGEVNAQALVAAQPYSSFNDYLARAGKGAYKACAVNLVKIGALDEFGDRAAMLREIEYRWAGKDIGPGKWAKANQAQRDALVADKIAKYPKRFKIEVPDLASDAVLYEIEKELVGSFVTIDPMGRYVSDIDAETIRNPSQIRKYLPGQSLRIGGQIVKIRKTKTKKGRNPGSEMAFMGVEWQGNTYDIVVFPGPWERFKYSIEMGAPVICECERLDNGVCLTQMLRLDKIWDEYGN